MTATAFGPHQFVGVVDDPEHCITCGLVAVDGRAEHVEELPELDDVQRAQAALDALPTPHLPVPIGNADGIVDVEALAVLAPQLRRDLVDAVRYAALQVRAARGRVVTPEDTFDLVRRLAHGGEVLRQMAGAFEAAAKECDALLEEEALTATGEQDGVPNGSLFVPDGAGTRIALRADYKAGRSSWDVATLCGWLAEVEATKWAENHSPDLAEDKRLFDVNDAAGIAERVASDALDHLLRLGNYTPKSTELDAERIAAAERGDDVTAGLLAQLRTVGERTYQGVKVTREAQPKSKRTTS